MFVRHEMHRDQTDGPRSDNFTKHMHDDKASSPTNVQIAVVLDIYFQVKKIGVHSEVYEWLSRKALMDAAKLRFTTLLVKIIGAFDWHIYI